MNFKKNDILNLKIDDIGVNGEGIGHAEGMTFFVKDALPGDLIRAGVTKVKKTYAYARLIELIEESPDRVKPKCPVAKTCGGCQIQHLSYEKQLEFKERRVRENLIRIGGIDSPTMEPIVGMDDPWHFRNKEQFPIRKLKDGRIHAGFFASRTHSLVPVDECLLGKEINAKVTKCVLSFMDEHSIPPYDEREHSGVVRHVLIRCGFSTGEVMVCIVINADMLPHSDALVERLECCLGGESKGDDACNGENIEYKIKDISLNINKEKSNVILGRKQIQLYGEGYITDELKLQPEYYHGHMEGEPEAVSFQISPLSFYQVNPIQTQKLYSIACDYANLTGNEVVWDLYCGIGTISLFASSLAKEVYGIEIIPEAIEDAKRNARLNGIENAEFFVGKAEEIAPLIVSGDNSLYSGVERPDVVIVDPPRKGCDEKLLDAICTLSPDRVVYVSCDPATLARDVKYLCEHGFEFVKARAVDQFGHSTHVETVVQLVNIGVKPD